MLTKPSTFPWAPAGLLAGAAALFLFRLGRVGLYDLDESVYAEISRETLALGDWLTPHLDFIPYLEKPPLLYWLNAASFRILGFSEFSARLATALAAVAGVGFTYGIGREIWGRRAGLGAGAALATSFGYFVFGRMAMPDMLFVATLTAAFWGFTRALLSENRSAGAAMLGYAAMGGAVLSKGLIGAVIPAVAIGALLLITRDWRLLRRLAVVRGTALFLLIAIPYHAAIALKYPGFLWFYVGNEHLARFLGRRQLVNFETLPLPTFLAISLALFGPWTVFLPAAIRRCWPRRRADGRSDRGTLLALLWAGAVVGMFALSASRLEYYCLPALPALALLVGRLWDLEAGGPEGGTQGRLSASWIALVALAACLLPAAALFPRLEQIHYYNMFPEAHGVGPQSGRALPSGARVDIAPGFASLVPVLEAAGAVMFTGALVSALAWRRRHPAAALAVAVGAAGMAYTVLEGGFLLFEPYRSSVHLASVLRAEHLPGEAVVIEGVYEHHAGLAFYTGLPMSLYRSEGGILRFGSRYVDAAATFLPDAKFGDLWAGSGRAFLLSEHPERLAQLREWSAATCVLGRSGNSWLFSNRAR